MHEGTAVGERDELGEGVWPLGAAEERCVPNLGMRRVWCGRSQGVPQSAEGTGRGNWGRHWRVMGGRKLDMVRWGVRPEFLRRNFF